MKNMQDYHWNYITAICFCLAGVVLLLANNPIWFTFLPLAVVFFAVGSDAQRKRAQKNKAAHEKTTKSKKVS